MAMSARGRGSSAALAGARMRDEASGGADVRSPAAHHVLRVVVDR